MDRPLNTLHELQRRQAAEGDLFWAAPDLLAVLDPALAAAVSATNFRDQHVPDMLGDLVAGRRTQISWTRVRAAWMPRLRQLCGSGGVTALHDRMARLLAESTGREHDLSQLAQRVCTYPLVPVVIDGLSRRDAAGIRRDVTIGFTNLSNPRPEPRGRWQSSLEALAAVRAGFIIRAELRGRARGDRSRRPDLADPLVDLLPELGIGRAVDAVSALLTAIAGPPGAVGGCLLYALQRYPGWATRIRAELTGVEPAQLHAPGAAPDTMRFVREVLRMWSPPLVLVRQLRVPVELPGVSLSVGQRCLVSPYLIHHDPKRWSRPDEFDPDRWLPGAAERAAARASYVPFGFPPKACVGAGVGMIQMMLLCHLVSTRFRIEPSGPVGARDLALAAVAVPVNLRGTVRHSA